LFRDAMNYLGGVVARRGKVLFVGTKRAAQEAVAQEAARCNMPYVNQRWLGGMLTNFKTVRQSVKRLKELKAMEEDGSLERLSKKEALGLRRERDKLNRSLAGIEHMDSLPDALLIIDVGHERIAVAEAKKLRIPVVAVVDTNHTPDGVDYVIPGNDDAIRAVQLYLQTAADAVLDSRQAISEHLTAQGDDFVELDETGAPLVGGGADAGDRKRAARKPRVQKRPVVAAADEAVTPADGAAADEAVAPADGAAVAEAIEQAPEDSAPAENVVAAEEAVAGK
jgi:small subunit ribosomal protein S2